MSILRIASYNIHKGVSAFGRQARIHHLKQAIAGLDADILFLQEVQGRHDLHAQRHAGWPDAGQHEFLAGDSHHHAYGKNAVYQHGHHGNALLSRYPIFSAENHDVSDHRLEQRGILHVARQPAPVAADLQVAIVTVGRGDPRHFRPIDLVPHEFQHTGSGCNGGAGEHAVSTTGGPDLDLGQFRGCLPFALASGVHAEFVPFAGRHCIHRVSQSSIAGLRPGVSGARGRTPARML